MSLFKTLIAFAFCVQFISAADAKEVCVAASESSEAQAAYAGALALINEKNQAWIGDACEAISKAHVSYLRDYHAWSVGFADDGDCSGNVFLDVGSLSVTAFGLVGCY